MSIELFEKALAAEGVTGKLAALAKSIYTQESGGGKNTKTSNRGARGGMQIIPDTFAAVADKEWSIDDPLQNARAGIRYLKQLDKQSGGVPELTAAGYYGGPGGLEKARRGVAVSDPVNPNAPNTLQYGAQVAARMGVGSAPAQVQVAAAPAAQPAGAGLQVAAVPLPVAPAPPEIVAQVAPQVQAQAPVGGGPDAWQAFLQGMPQTRQPVNVADIDYANPQPAMHVPQFQFNPTPVANRVPNFAAFSSWKGRAA